MCMRCRSSSRGARITCPAISFPKRATMTDPLQMVISWAVLALPGIVLTLRMIGAVREKGGNVRAEAFGWPDVLLAFFLCGFFALSTLLAGLSPGEPLAE